MCVLLGVGGVQHQRSPIGLSLRGQGTHRCGRPLHASEALEDTGTGRCPAASRKVKAEERTMLLLKTVQFHGSFLSKEDANRLVRRNFEITF